MSWIGGERYKSWADEQMFTYIASGFFGLRGREAERQGGRGAARQRGDRSKRGGLCKDRVCTTELNWRYSYIIKVNAITRATLPVTAGIDVEGKPCITSPESTIPGKASTPNTCSSIGRDRVFAVEFYCV